MTSIRRLLGAVVVVAFFTVASSPTTAGAPKVVASILPIHSLVAGVMEGVGEPALIVSGSRSPHAYQLRATDARNLENARVVFWVGVSLESFLEKPLSTLAKRARVVELMTAQGIELLAARGGGAWRSEARHRDQRDDADGDHARWTGDPHLWLAPENARRIVAVAVVELSMVNPANAVTYAKNGAALTRRIDALDLEIRQDLEGLQDVPYVVFHDAYQYLERHFGLNALGSLTASPDQLPSAKRLKELRARLMDLDARCVFGERQFASALVDTIAEGTGAAHGVLDPLGAHLAPGPDAWFEMMRANARELANCLSGRN